jgi:hypothetical protein
MITFADKLPIAFLLAVVVVIWWRDVLKVAAVVAMTLLIIGVIVLLGNGRRAINDSYCPLVVCMHVKDPGVHSPGRLSWAVEPGDLGRRVGEACRRVGVSA